MIVAAPREILERRLRLEGVVERRVLGGVQESLRESNRHRWALGEPLRELPSDIGETVGGDDRGHESEGVSLVGAQVALPHQDLERTMPADPGLAALVGACDGDLPVGALIDAIASLLEVDADELRVELLPAVRELVFTGFLHFDD